MLEKISKIENIGTVETIDIEVSGDNLFYANDILTHNSSSDLELGDTSESFGLPMTVDFMIGLSSSEELESLFQILVKQLKNRYNDIAVNKRFIVGIDKSHMRLHDVEESAQNIMGGPSSNSKSKDKSVFDNSRFGESDFERNDKSKKFFTADMFKEFS